ncbi:MAG: YggS family pyridoxal phosphate-dependent enzyme [Bacteroidales bacterium]|nr:YggS family pyridoxal phosphate-dependent enzyme [Prevotella sp.]MCI6294217.1 YggS family pyridoxal phosphate-dependent enzyme [Bacteroidales bacterium]MCI7050677.1 YggS family pyridoxal phosphate-dependent enzyme [Bacteroidales bacterium]MDD6731559.1 YggS family pyridoxal phosphate-dependent enzyme [Bacteroidales bacterium]MDY4558160.1 YggS family pyridoxal phosphate-dependent enzyme [Alloprevotella sp.]
MVHLQEIKADIRPGVELVAVSKYHPAEAIRQAYAAGQRAFGESRVQELQAKRQELPNDIEWHFIGHLQPNKVKYIAPYISLIHAVDSFKLLLEIEKQAAKVGRIIPCLLELRVAQEATKYGFTPAECTAMLAEGQWRNLHHVKLCGIMCMASHTDATAQIRQEFHTAYSYFQEVKARFFADAPAFCQRSWGMSHDYHLAMDEGATMVRIGSAIFD